MKYRITIVKQFIALLAILIIFIFSTGFIFYFNHTQGNKSHALGFFSILFIIALLPVLYLHLEYYHFNKDTELDIVPSENKLLYFDKNSKLETIYFNELSKIMLYGDFTWIKKKLSKTTPWAHYHYAKIFTKEGKVIIITSLMATFVEKALSPITGVPIEKKRRGFASILLG